MTRYQRAKLIGDRWGLGCDARRQIEEQIREAEEVARKEASGSTSGATPEDRLAEAWINCIVSDHHYHCGMPCYQCVLSLIHSAEHKARQEEREAIAAELTSGDYCRLAEHMIQRCNCEDISAAIRARGNTPATPST